VVGFKIALVQLKPVVPILSRVHVREQNPDGGEGLEKRLDVHLTHTQNWMVRVEDRLQIDWTWTEEATFYGYDNSIGPLVGITQRIQLPCSPPSKLPSQNTLDNESRLGY
jgi:hypothetical protein